MWMLREVFLNNMFTGIVQAVGSVVALEKKVDFFELQIDIPASSLDNLQIGASICVNGVCLTVTQINKTTISFDLNAETMDLTTLSKLKVGDSVNIERSLKYGDEIGGHIVSGHVDTTANVISIEESTHTITLEVDPKFMKYIFVKGFIAIDGASLTVNEIDAEKGQVTITLIGETLRQTHFNTLEVGDILNIEIDRSTQVLVDTLDIRIKLYPKNFDVVRSFYQDILKFSIIKEWNRSIEDRGVMFNAGNFTLELLSHDGEFKEVQGCDISIEHENVVEYWESFKDTKHVVFELRDNEWGDSSFGIQDPEGFKITFFTKH